jgi:hypothetical protein
MTLRSYRWGSDSCECMFHFTYDDADPDNTTTVSNIERECAFHSSLSDHQTKYSTALEENQRKNRGLGHILENGPSTLYDLQQDGLTRTLKNSITYNFSYTGTVPNRVLHISFTGITLTNPQKSALNSVLNTRFGTGKVVID